jgi:hypothetical protein
MIKRLASPKPKARAGGLPEYMYIIVSVATHSCSSAKRPEQIILSGNLSGYDI